MSPDPSPPEALGSTPEPALPPGRAARGGQALEKAVQYLTWLVPVLEKFPRSQRFLLGDRLQSLALRTVEDLVEATYTRSPTAVLQRANIGLEQQRVLVRVAYNLRHLDVKRYEFAVRKLDEIGRSVGAWLRQMAGRTGPGARALRVGVPANG
jgi:hypothetical protein